MNCRHAVTFWTSEDLDLNLNHPEDLDLNHPVNSMTFYFYYISLYFEFYNMWPHALALKALISVVLEWLCFGNSCIIVFPYSSMIVPQRANELKETFKLKTLQAESKCEVKRIIKLSNSFNFFFLFFIFYLKVLLLTLILE